MIRIPHATSQEILHPDTRGRRLAARLLFLAGWLLSLEAAADNRPDAGTEDSDRDSTGETDETPKEDTEADSEEDTDEDTGEDNGEDTDTHGDDSDTSTEEAAPPPAGTERFEAHVGESISPRPALPAPLPVVCLSPGHPSSPGDKNYEAVLNRRVAYKLRSLLLDAGYGVVLTVEDLTEETLFAPAFDSEDEKHWSELEVKTPEEKAAVCNETSADFVISIHHNYAYNPETNYTLVFYSAEAEENAEGETLKKWARTTARALGRVMRTDGSRAFSDLERLGFNLSIAANSAAPTILTEAAFYSNPAARRRLNSLRFIEREAQALFDAFHAHYRKYHRHHRAPRP